MLEDVRGSGLEAELIKIIHTHTHDTSREACCGFLKTKRQFAASN